jgi:hypothetical protein
MPDYHHTFVYGIGLTTINVITVSLIMYTVILRFENQIFFKSSAHSTINGVFWILGRWKFSVIFGLVFSFLKIQRGLNSGL